MHSYRSLAARFAFVFSVAFVSASATAQTTTLQLDDGDMEELWRLTSPNAGPGDWVAAAYEPPLEYPFRVVSAMMHYLDGSCCISGFGCDDGWCTNPSPKFDRRIIAPADLLVDAAGLTPDISNYIIQDASPSFLGAGANDVSPPWAHYPDTWNLPASTIFDHEGRIFYAIKWLTGDDEMYFAVDRTGSAPTDGISIYASDDFTTRSSIWPFGNIGMRVTIEPIFFLKLAASLPSADFWLAGADDVTMISLRVGGGNGSTTITRLRVNASGSGNDATAVDSVRLVVDLNRDGEVSAGEPTIATGAFSSNNGYVDLFTSRTISSGSAEEWLVVYDFNTTPNGGHTFVATISGPGSISSNQGNPYLSGTVNGSGSLSGNTVTIAGQLSVSVGPSTMPSRIAPSGTQNLATLQLRVAALNESFTISRIAVTAGGSLNDPPQVESVRLFLDNDRSGTLTGPDSFLGIDVFTADNGMIEFTLAPITITLNNSRDFIVVYNISANAPGGNTFQTILASASDLSATGAYSGPLPPIGPRALSGAPVIGNLATVGGALTVGVGAANPPNGTAQPGTTEVPMLQIDFNARAEAISINALTFSGSGTGDEVADIARATLYRDVNGNGVVDTPDVMAGLPQSYASDNGIVTFALTNETVPENGSRMYLLTYDFTTNPTGGETFTAAVTSATAITATGVASGAPTAAQGTFPINGGARTMLGGLSFTLGPENPPASNYQPGAGDVAVLQLLVSAQGETFDISRVDVTAAGSMLEDTSVSQLELWLDSGTLGARDVADTRIGTANYAVDDGTAVFNLSPVRSLSSGANERWLVTYDLTLTPQPGQTFRAEITDGSAVSAVGTLSGPAAVGGLPAQGNMQAIGGTLVVTPGPANPAGGAIAPDATDVVMFQARLTSGLEPITINAVTFTGSGSGNELTDIANARLFVDANEDGQLDTVGDIQLGAPQNFTQNDGRITFGFAGRTIPASSSESWIVVYDLNGAANAGDTFQVLWQANTDLVGSAPSGPLPRANGAPVSGGARTVLGSLLIERGTASPTASVIPRHASDVPILQLSLSGIQESFVISSLTFQAAGSVDDVGDITGATLLLDGDQSGTRTMSDTVLSGPVAFSGDDGTVTFNFSTNIAAGSSQSLLVVVDLAGSAAGGTTLRLNLTSAPNVTATGYGARAASPVGLPVSSDTMTVGGILEVGLGPESPIARVVRPNQLGVEAMQLRFIATTEPVSITSLTLSISGSGNDATGIATVDLFVDGDGNGLVGAGEPQIGTSSFSVDDGTITFPLTQTVQVGPALYLLLTSSMTNSPIGGETFQLSLDPASGLAISSTSNAVVVGGVPVDGALLTAGGGFEMALGQQSSAGGSVNQAAQDVPLMQLTMRAVNEACTVNSLTLRGIGGIDDAQDISAARLMRDVNDNGTVDFADVAIGSAATYSNDDGTITFSGLSQAIGTNAEEQWLVVYDLTGSASNNETFAVRLESNSDVSVSCNISGPVIPSGAPIEGNQFTIQEDGALVLQAGAQTPPDLFLAKSSVRTAVLQVRVAASVQDLTLTDLTLTADVDGGAPADTIANVELFRDVNQDGVLDRSDYLIASGSPPDAAGLVPFTGLSVPVQVAEAVFLIASVNITASATPGVQFDVGITNNADAIATSGFGNAVTTGAPVLSGMMTVAGDLNVADAAPTMLTVHNDDEDLLALDFTMTAVAESFRLRSITITAEGTMEPATTVTGLELFSDEDGDGTVTSADRSVASGITFPQGATRTTIAGLDEGITPQSPSRFLIALDLAGIARVDQTLTLSIAANVDILAEGTQIGLTSPIGAPLLGNGFTIGSSLELALGPSTLSDQIVAANAEHVPALQIVATASNEDVTLSRLSLNTAGTLNDMVAIEAVRLILDANQDGTFDQGDIEVGTPARPTGDNGTVTFSPLAERLSRNAEQTYLVTVDLSGSGLAGENVLLSLAADSDVTAFGSISGAISSTGAPITGAQIALVGALNVRLGSASPPGVGVAAGATFPAMQLELMTRGETVNIEQITLRLQGSANDAQAIGMARLWRDLAGDGVVSDDDIISGSNTPDGDDGLIVFSSLGLQIPADNTVKLLAELELAESAEPGGTIRVSLESNDDVRATGATSGNITTVGAPLEGSSFTIVKKRTQAGQPEVVEDGCGCAATSGTSRSAPLLLGLWLLLLSRRWSRSEGPCPVKPAILP